MTDVRFLPLPEPVLEGRWREEGKSNRCCQQEASLGDLIRSSRRLTSSCAATPLAIPGSTGPKIPGSEKDPPCDVTEIGWRVPRRDEPWVLPGADTCAPNDWERELPVMG